MGENLNGKRILFINLGTMMEVLYSIPMFNVLTDNYPSANFYYLLDSEHKEILNKAVELDKLIVYNKSGLIDVHNNSKILNKSSYLKLFNWVRGEKFDYIIDLAPSFKSSFLQFLKLTAKKIKVKEDNQHLSQRYLSILDLFELEHNYFNASLPGRGIEGDYIKRVFNRLLPNDSNLLVGIAPASNRDGDWPDKKYTQLCDWINQNLDANLLLLGRDSLKQRNAQIASNVKDEVIDITNKLNLKRLEVAISNLDLLITANPAAIYLAAANCIPVIALAGGFNIDKLSPIKVPNIVLKGSNNQLENLDVTTVGDMIPQLI